MFGRTTSAISYVVDSSFFLSSAALNPGPTIAANALGVAGRIATQPVTAP